MSERLVKAAIALAWSEAGANAELRGEQNADELYEPWPAMDELCAALDEASPGWRRNAPPEPRTDEAEGE